MNTNNIMNFGLLVLIQCFAQTNIRAQVNIETSAIPVFWELVDTLSADQAPSNELWEKFADHPAYAQIEQSGNRVSYLKRVLPIVFRPSKADKLRDVLNGKESFQQYLAQHLVEINLRRQELNEYLQPGKIDQYKDAYKRSLKYLPKDIQALPIDLTIYIALFEDNGFGGKVIVLDLLHMLKATDEENMDFLGHEFHHALRNQSKMYEIFVPKDSSSLPIISALNKLPLEGVACMIDNKKYFQPSYSYEKGVTSTSQQETVAEFKDHVEKAGAYLKQIDSILSGNKSNEEKGKAIFGVMPWSGHTIGFYMATAIENAFGKEKLIEVQYSSPDFLLTYQKAAANQSALYSFSEKTINFLTSIK
jgi:hypothetical protein